MSAKKGSVPWNKGKKLTTEHKRALSVSHIGKKPWLGKKHTKESKEKNSLSNKGRIAWNRTYSDPAESKRFRSWCKNKRNRTKRLLVRDGKSHTFAEWELLKKQYGNTCPCCMKSEPVIKLTKDHIIPIIKGGTDCIENIQPLCQPCNSMKHTKIIKFNIIPYKTKK
jgi:5-methylcytosine-specific restriction endonuclease McrA